MRRHRQIVLNLLGIWRGAAMRRHRQICYPSHRRRESFAQVRAMPFHGGRMSPSQTESLLPKLTTYLFGQKPTNQFNPHQLRLYIQSVLRLGRASIGGCLEWAFINGFPSAYLFSFRVFLSWLPLRRMSRDMQKLVSCRLWIGLPAATRLRCSASCGRSPRAARPKKSLAEPWADTHELGEVLAAWVGYIARNTRADVLRRSAAGKGDGG